MIQVSKRMNHLNSIGDYGMCGWFALVLFVYMRPPYKRYKVQYLKKHLAKKESK